MHDVRSALVDAVFAAIDDLNDLRPANQRLVKSLDTTLAGEDGPLDSLAFVNLIVGLEQRLDGVFDQPVNLLDDERLDPTAEHFRTVGSLVSYLERLREPRS